MDAVEVRLRVRGEGRIEESGSTTKLIAAVVYSRIRRTTTGNRRIQFRRIRQVEGERWARGAVDVDGRHFMDNSSYPSTGVPHRRRW
jgi:hypothetical protein